MKLIEKLQQGKQNQPDLCEDLYVFNGNFAAVIDGATNITGQTIGGKAPGRFAAELIKEALEKLNKRADLEEMIFVINEHMQAAYHAYNLLESIKTNKWMAPTASVVVFSRFHQEVWQIGDCQLIIDGTLYQNEKELDKITANARALFLEAELKKGQTIDSLLACDSGWEYIKPLVQQQYYLQNDKQSQYGFEVINGFPVDLAKVQVTNVPRNTEYLILASDGYPYLKPTLQESEALLAQLLEEDPLCFRSYKSAKGLVEGNVSFDDRLYLKFKLL